MTDISQLNKNEGIIVSAEDFVIAEKGEQFRETEKDMRNVHGIDAPTTHRNLNYVTFLNTWKAYHHHIQFNLHNVKLRFPYFKPANRRSSCILFITSVRMAYCCEIGPVGLRTGSIIRNSR